MRKHFIILLILLCAAPLPCFAQTDYSELHSISNTLWKLFPQDAYFGFAGGVVYMCDESLTACAAAEDSFYKDFILFALFYVPIKDDYTGFIFGFVPSVGWRGRLVVYNYPLRYTMHGTLLLASDTWTPPE